MTKFLSHTNTKTRLASIFFILVYAVAIAGCGASSPYYKNADNRPDEQAGLFEAADPHFTLFFIGDTGSPATDPLEPNLQVLQHHLKEAGERSAVVFLGDNIYSYGLLPEDHPERNDSERRIDAQLGLLKNYPGQAIFIPGNHDWNDDRPGGLQALQRQQQYIETHLGDAAFAPNSGCPGPMEIRLDSSNVLLVLDTEWWLYPHKKPGLKQCENGSNEHFIQAVDSLITANGTDNIFVAAHHPLYSNGTHNGYFPVREHVFPVWYIPLPIITSVNPLYRRYVGYRQDLAGKEYSQMRDELTTIFSKHRDLVYASGHDHSLQYHPIGGQHYIVSGAGTVQSYVRKGKSAAFAYSHKGFARIDIYAQKSVLSFWTPEGDQSQGKQVYKRVLYKNN